MATAIEPVTRSKRMTLIYEHDNDAAPSVVIELDYHARIRRIPESASGPAETVADVGFRGAVMELVFGPYDKLIIPIPRHVAERLDQVFGDEVQAELEA